MRDNGPFSPRTPTLRCRVPTPALVADDDPTVRSVTAALLTSCGFDVTAVADGVEATDILTDPAGPPFAVAVIDCDMPRLDGPGVLARVRAAGSRLPILLISGRHSLLTIPAAGDLLAAFLPKPFTLDTLRRAVEALLAADEPVRVTFGGARTRDGEG